MDSEIPTWQTSQLLLAIWLCDTISALSISWLLNDLMIPNKNLQDRSKYPFKVHNKGPLLGIGMPVH